MNSKMYVGNLSFDSTERELREVFEQFGEVTDVFIPIDRSSGASRGFAFVTMGSAENMRAATAALDGKEHAGRTLTVNEARAKTDNGGYSSGGYRPQGRSQSNYSAGRHTY